MERASKEHMLQVLATANVIVPTTASIAQIRTLYDDLIANPPAAPADDLPHVPDAPADDLPHVPDAPADDLPHVPDAPADDLPYVPDAPADNLPVALSADLPYVPAVNLPVAPMNIVRDVVVSNISTAASDMSVASAASNMNMPSNNDAFLCNNVQTVDLDAELARLQKQREILKLRNEINNFSVVGAPFRIDISAIESMVPKFTGEGHYDVNKWINDLEDAFDVLHFDERAKLVGCRRLIDGTAKVFLRTITAASYLALKRLLLDEFGRHHTLQEVYKELANHKYKPDDNLRRYVLEMQEIAAQAVVPEAELVDFIICGINDQTNSGSMLYAATTIKELKCLLERYERYRQKPVKSANKSNSFAPGRAESRTLPSSETHTNLNAARARGPNDPAPRCYNCSRFGHYQNECPQPKRADGSCFKCGRLDHIYRDCPNRAKRLVAATHMAEVVDSMDSLHMVSVSFNLKSGKCSDHVNLLSLFDSGSPKTFVSSKCVPSEYINELMPTKYFGVGHTNLLTYGKIVCTIMYDNKAVKHEVIILPAKMMSVCLIIGRDLLTKFNVHLCKIKIKYSHHDLMKYSNKSNKIEDLHMIRTLKDFGLFKEGNIALDCQVNGSIVLMDNRGENLATTGDPQVCIPSNCRITHFDDDIAIQVCSIIEEPSEFNINPNLPTDDCDRLKKIIFESYFNFPADQIVPSDYSMKINLMHDTPIYCRPRPLSYDERLKVRQIINDLLEEHIIQPSESPYASAIVLVPKKNGKLRKCVDYRPINKITIRDNHPLPLIDNCLEHLGGKNYFSILDLKNGFHQVKVHPESVKYTAFVTPDGQYEYLRMPFGLKNAPAVFQRIINNVLRSLIDSGKLVVYLDDIIIATKTFSEHVLVIGEVLGKLRKHNLEINVEKCKFAFEELNYLGYRATSKGITPSNSHIEAIQKYPIPTNKHELQQCLGLFSFFRRFVPSFSRIAYPLTQLLKKNTSFNFDEQCLHAFYTLRELLTSAPVLSIYDPKLTTELHCDASSRGFGSVLMQQQAYDNKFHPVAYFSKTTSSAESKLHSYELETLAVVYSLQRFHTYLHGIPFKIVTDCNSLAQTLSNKNSSAKIARWALKFEDYDYTVQHRPGKAMGHVDALSRSEISMVASILEQKWNVAAVDEADLDFQLQLTQRRDPQIKTLLSQLEHENLEEFLLKDGLVFRKTSPSTLQLYVPAEMIDNLIRHIHEKIGHLGTEKCCSQIKKNYWFPRMKNRVDNFIKNCLKCIIYSPSNRNNKHNLFNIPKQPIPFDTLHIDHLGPLPAVNSKKKYLLVVIDAFTKFIKLYPAYSTNTKEVCHALEDYFNHYSRPRRIISDRGTCFTSNEFDKFLKDQNIIHIKVATASPQANGQVERVNRVLRPMLSKLSEPYEHGDWVQQ